MAAPRSRIPRNVKLTPAERTNIEELLGTDITLLGPVWEFINTCLNYKEPADQALTSAEFILELPSFLKFAKTGAIVSALGTASSLADLVLGPLGNVLAVVKASVAGRELFAYAGMSYGLTAWAFGHGRPKPSESRLSELMKSKPQEKRLYRQAWYKGVDATTREYDKLAGPKAKRKKALQKVLRGIGENDPKTLNLRLMKSMEPKVKRVGGQTGLNKWRYFNEGVKGAKYAYPK